MILLAKRLSIAFVVATFGILQYSMAWAASLPTNQADVADKSCAAIEGGQGITVSQDEVLSGRYPSPDSLKVSEECKIQARKQIDDWKQTDLSNWDQLSNQACSAKLGWVEKNPGTCRAGGPPPICPVNHWIRVSPSEALRQRANIIADIRAAREHELQRAACQCWRSQLESQGDQGPTPYGVRFHLNPGYINETFPALSKACTTDSASPPGYKCFAPGCERESFNASPADQAADGKSTSTLINQMKANISNIYEEFFEADYNKLAVNAAGEALLLNVIPKQLEPYSKAMEAFGYLTDNTDADVSKWSNAYERTLQHINDDLFHIQTSVDTVDEIDRGPHSASRLKILSQLDDQMSSLEQSMDMLSDYYDEVMRTSEVSEDACPEVFDFRHDALVKSFHGLDDRLQKIVKSLPPGVPPLGAP